MAIENILKVIFQTSCMCTRMAPGNTRKYQSPGSKFASLQLFAGIVACFDRVWLKYYNFKFLSIFFLRKCKNSSDACTALKSAASRSTIQINTHSLSRLLYGKMLLSMNALFYTYQAGCLKSLFLRKIQENSTGYSVCIFTLNHCTVMLIERFMCLCIVLSPFTGVCGLTIKWLVWPIGNRTWVSVRNTGR